MERNNVDKRDPSEGEERRRPSDSNDSPENSSKKKFDFREPGSEDRQQDRRQSSDRGGYRQRRDDDRRSYGDRDNRRSYGDRDNRRSYGDRDDRRSYGDRDNRRSYGDRDDRRSYGDRDNRRSYGDRDNRRSYGDRDDRRSYGDRDNRRSYGDRDDRRSYGDRDNRRSYGDRDNRRSYGDRDDRRSYGDRRSGGGYQSRGGDSRYSRGGGQQRYSKPRKMFTPQDNPEGMRINRFIANAGICSRREADKLVETGEIMINGEVVTTLGTRITPTDVVTYKGEVLQGEKMQYILFNKPKDTITTAEDPEGRRTVMEYLDGACEERIFPVGRLDRNTTGLLLFTNDGHLAEKLMHPKNRVKKLYHVKLDRPVSKYDMQKISNGIKLEDGYIKADQITYAGMAEDKSEIGIEIHSGKNRIVRRIFESLEYEVVKLDRVIFAGLTKKDLRRGKFRSLTEEEVNFLKML